jgi:hypothetical protein
MDSPSRHLSFYAAVLWFASLAIGGLAGLALGGQVDFYDGKIMLGAHLAGGMGALFLVAVAYTLPMLSLKPSHLRTLVWSTILANFSNTMISAFKAFLGVHGTAPVGGGSNILIFVLLNVFVVIPSFVGAGLWIYGFRR